MVACVEWAWQQSFDKLVLTVMSSNEEAKAMYEACGFFEEARLRGEFLVEGRSVDDLFMARWREGAMADQAARA